MRIAIITETFLPSTDGIVTRLCHTIEWLTKEGHQVLVVAPDLGVTYFGSAKVVGIPAHSFFLYPDKKLAMPSRKVGYYLRQFQPDLVHVVNPAVLGIAGVYYGWREQWPIVASYHTQIPYYADYYRVPFLKPVLWWFFRTLHNRAVMNLCTSASVQRDLEQHRFRNVHVWRRGVDLQGFGPQYRDWTMRERLTNGKPSNTLLLFVGRLAVEKEIETIRSVLLAKPDVCLAIVGDGPNRSFLQEYFKGTNTVFTGFMHGPELAKAYSSADIFVFPSTTETLGLVLIEAMASGLPVVAARSGPTEEQLKHRVTGMLYDPSDTQSLVGSITELQNEELRRNIARLSRDSVQNLSWASASSQLFSFYTQVMECLIQKQSVVQNI